jgi:hypothetical protein
VFNKDFLGEQFDVYLDVVSCLKDIDTVVHVEVTLTFDRLRKFFIDEVHEDVGGGGIGSSNGKVVNLAEKKNTVAVDRTGVKAWFVDGWRETKAAEYFVRVLLPKSR